MHKRNGWMETVAVAAVTVLVGGLAGPVAAQITNGNHSANQSGSKAAVYLNETQSTGYLDTGAVEGARLGYADIRNPDIWGRAIYHGDGSYTESKQDAETNSLTQETKSAGGVLLQKRLISLDAKGRPSEILIYDGRGQYRYRGQILYNSLGLPYEEQIYDTNSRLLRRRIQEYDPLGKRLRLKVVDDLSKIPADLRLVITRVDGAGHDKKAAARNYEQFVEAAEERSTDPRGKTKEKKPGFFRRMFKKN